MVRTIRHLFQRGEVTEQELRTLHGIVTELSLGRRQRGRDEAAIGEDGARDAGSHSMPSNGDRK